MLLQTIPDLFSATEKNGKKRSGNARLEWTNRLRVYRRLLTNRLHGKAELCLANS